MCLGYSIRKQSCSCAQVKLKEPSLIWRCFSTMNECFRQETYYGILRSLINTIKIVNGHSFPLIFFLIVFGVLWYQKAPFDTEFFTVAFVLISYLRHTYLHGFANAFVNLSQYFVAVKRIQVESWFVRDKCWFSFNCLNKKEFLLSAEHHHSQLQLICHNAENEHDLKLEINRMSSQWTVNCFEFPID